MQLLERYNAILRSTEDGTITMLNRILDASFNRLVRRARAHLRTGHLDPAQRNLALLQEFRQLIPAFNPNAVDSYDRLFRDLVGTSSRTGLTAADDLTGLVRVGPRVDVSIPLEATVAAAGQAKGYLRRHGETFAETSADAVARAVAEGRPMDALVTDLRRRLGVVKSRAETIARTESLRAYHIASNDYYAAQGIDLVVWYATADDRSCAVCAPRAGKIYKRRDIKLPLHPRCRCMAAPYDADINNIDPNYSAALKRHSDEVRKAAKSPLSPDLVRSVFETSAPQPIGPA